MKVYKYENGIFYGTQLVVVQLQVLQRQHGHISALTGEDGPHP